MASCCTYLPEVKLDPRTNLAVDFQPFLFYLKLLETDVNNPSLFLDRKSKTIVGVVAIDTKIAYNTSRIYGGRAELGRETREKS